jgi:hypothetical protein
MTLGEARALVRLYINEPKAAHWTDAQLDTLIKLSNIDVFHQLVAQSPDSFTAVNQVEIPANASGIDLGNAPLFYSNTLKNGFFTRILGVATANAKANPSTGVNFAGAPGTATSPIPPVTRITDLYQFGNGQDNASMGVNNSRPLTWKAINNTTLYFYPHPQQVTWLWVWYIPSIQQPTSDTGVLLRAGSTFGTAWNMINNVEVFDELVPLLAAVKAKASVGDQDDGLAGIYRSRVDTMKQVLASSLQNMTPQTIMGNNIGR